MISVGTRVIVHWEYYEYENNIELAYYGSDTFHGVVLEFDDNNAEDRRLKNIGNCLKVKIDEKGKMPNNICYPLEKDVEIDENYRSNEENLQSNLENSRSKREMSESEIIVRNACQGWTRCTEGNYPDSYNDIVIAYWYEDGKEWLYYSRHECPYRWNVLCRSEAYWRSLSAPIRNKEE